VLVGRRELAWWEGKKNSIGRLGMVEEGKLVQMRRVIKAAKDCRYGQVENPLSTS
jgi:hypothetical protein